MENGVARGEAREGARTRQETALLTIYKEVCHAHGPSQGNDSSSGFHEGDQANQ
jgi:hypothetical protein